MFCPTKLPQTLCRGCHGGTKHGPIGKERKQTLIITCSWFQIQTMGTQAGLHGWDTLERMVKLSPRAIETANAVFRVLSAMPSYRNRPQRVDMPIIWPTYIYIQNICTHVVVSFSVIVEGVINQLWNIQQTSVKFGWFWAELVHARSYFFRNIRFRLQMGAKSKWCRLDRKSVV